MAGIFKESVLTKKGIALLAKAQAGRCTIKLTKAAAATRAVRISPPAPPSSRRSRPSP